MSHHEAAGAQLSSWVRQRLVCPYDQSPLRDVSSGLACQAGHTHRVVDGIPVLLRRDVAHTHHVADYALTVPPEDLLRAADDGIHPFVRQAIAATGGFMYDDVGQRMSEYPVPTLRLAPGNGRTFLDIGCNWGRWTLAAARAGYQAVGIDPSLEAVHAARHVARQLGLTADFLVAEARHLPFAPQSFETIFSYSVLQHLSKDDVRTTLGECGRVLQQSGVAMVQMPNRFGLRCLYHQMRRGFREPKAFEVRYWGIRELRDAFASLIGPATISVDGFFSLNPQPAEAHLLARRYQVVVNLSERLRRLSESIPPLLHVADSVYVRSTRRD